MIKYYLIGLFSILFNFSKKELTELIESYYDIIYIKIKTKSNIVIIQDKFDNNLY